MSGFLTDEPVWLDQMLGTRNSFWCREEAVARVRSKPAVNLISKGRYTPAAVRCR